MNPRNKLEIYSKISLLNSIMKNIVKYDNKNNVFNENQKLNLKEFQYHLISLCNFIKLDLSKNQDPSKIDEYEKIIGDVTKSLITPNASNISELYKKSKDYNIRYFLKKIYKNIDPLFTGLSIISSIIFPPSTFFGMVFDSFILGASLFPKSKNKKNSIDTKKVIKLHSKKMSELIATNKNCNGSFLNKLSELNLSLKNRENSLGLKSKVGTVKHTRRTQS